MEQNSRQVLYRRRLLAAILASIRSCIVRAPSLHRSVAVRPGHILLSQRPHLSAAGLVVVVVVVVIFLSFLLGGSCLV